VDALKAEKPMDQSSGAAGKANAHSQKSLSELEKTINALKTVIDKLQTENKRLKSKPPSTAGSSEKLKVNHVKIIVFCASIFNCT